MTFPATRSQETPAIRPKQEFRYNRVADADKLAWVTDVIHLPGGQRIMTCSQDGLLRVWNLESGKQIGEDWRDGKSRVNAIALSPDGKKIVSGSDDGVRLWNIDTGKVITKWTGHRGHVTSVCWNRDGGRVVSGSYLGTARVWVVESGENTLTIKTGFFVAAVIYSPDTTMIAIGGRTEETDLGIIKIWDANGPTAKLVANLKGHTGKVTSLAWTTDGKRLISGSFGSSITMWNTITWQQIQVLTGCTNYSRVNGIAISANGRILASASIDHTAQLWNLENGQLIGLPLQHAEPVTCVSFSTDGKLLATGSWDKNAYTWDVSAILRDVGLDYLLSDPNSLLDGGATRRPVRQLKDPRRLPPGFFDESPDPHFSGIRRLPTSSARQENTAEANGHTLFGHFSSLFRHTYHKLSHTPPQPRPLNRPRNTAKVHGRNGEGIELQERRLTSFDVPFAQGYRRNASAREVRMKKEKERNAKKASAGSSRPPKNSVTQQSCGAAQIQPSSQPHAAVSTSSTTPAITATPVVTTSTSALPDVTIRQAGRWTRFWLRFCCTSIEYTGDGHH